MSDKEPEDFGAGYLPCSVPAGSVDCEGGAGSARTDLTGAHLAHMAVRSTLWVGLGSYANQLIGFGAVLVMTRLLGPEVFGYFSLGTFWSSLINLRPKVGLHYVAIREAKTDGTLLGTYLVVDVAVAILSMILSLLVALLLWPIGYAREVSIALVVLVTFECLGATFAPLSMVLEKNFHLSRLTLVTLLASIVAYSTAIAMALMGMGIRALLAINGLSMAVSGIGVLWVCHRRYPQLFVWRWQFSGNLARHLLRQGVPVGLSLTTLTAVVNQFDNFLIGTFVSYTLLGYYDRAYRIATWPHLLLTMVIGRVAFVTFAKVKEDRDRLTHAVRLSLWLLLALGIPIVLILFFGARSIVLILYGPNWLASVPFLRFLVLYAFVWPIVNLSFWLSVALGHSRIVITLTSIQAATLVLVGTPLTIWLGVSGTLIGVAITMATALLVSTRYIFVQLRLSLSEVFMAPCLAGGLTAIVLVGAAEWFNFDWFPPLLHLGVVVTLCLCVFFILLYLLRPAETVDRIRYVWHRMAARSL
ncbi:MAG: oligosaccharide flippase family protein [Anaerolineae bacterium]